MISESRTRDQIVAQLDDWVDQMEKDNAFPEFWDEYGTNDLLADFILKLINDERERCTKVIEPCCNSSELAVRLHNDIIGDIE